jgi:hypothetical protein
MRVYEVAGDVRRLAHIHDFAMLAKGGRKRLMLRKLSRNSILLLLEMRFYLDLDCILFTSDLGLDSISTAILPVKIVEK